MKSKAMLGCAVTGLVAALGAGAAPERINAGAKRTLTTDDGRFGGCMVQLDERIANAGLDCPGSWVTFSCSGVHTSPDEGFRMFESAQMAFALDRELMVEVPDEMKHNGHCYARRVDVLRD